MTSLLSVAVLVTAVQALAFDGRPAQPTNGLIPNPTISMPEITLGPAIHELAKRQTGQTVLVAPDNTCGYVSGRVASAYTCNGRDYTCAIVTTSTIGAIACCDGNDCGLRVACVDYMDYVYSSACDADCAQDTFTAKCTHISAPYCGTVKLSSGISDFFCDTDSGSTPQQLYTTYSGQTGRTFTAVVVTIDDNSSTTRASSATKTGAGSSATNTASSGSDSSDNSSESNTSNSSNSSKSSTPVGAIVGGVVGGIGGLALIGLGIFFLIRHQNQKKKKAAAAAAAAAAAPQMQQGPPGAPAAGAAGFQQQQQQPYNPHYSQQYPSQPGSPPGFPQQTAYYPDPTKPGGFVAVAAEAPDRNSSTSPVSQLDSTNRPGSMQPPTSPTSTINSSWQHSQNGVVTGYPPQQPSPQPNVPPTVHEAGGNVVGERDYNANHHGQFHELG
ncbi:uncharacterized protein GGS22DRAFT_145883 [Annulohypoxylon maeteangense]|uniref:uncharacterized protein n=1 Tax=Annulohypoxylon maeteangense TaxID=1927788 RepID=UPI0020075F7C|nr:uncharacterized protein GGS22DRAFT_145883 [Annulohypoxylon maeteangense]KAI0884694.1 hypothetical protein GGS22DRAFT_145883 [Annulohypoxylon maeteangense]